MIPGQETFRGKNLLSNIPTKIVSDEVISAIQEHYIFSYGRGAAVGALSAGESTNSIPIPALQLSQNLAMSPVSALAIIRHQKGLQIFYH